MGFGSVTAAFLCCGSWHRIVGQVSNNISEEWAASIFKAGVIFTLTCHIQENLQNIQSEAVRRDSSAVSPTLVLCGQACGQFRGV